jgi:acyl-CoA synthetase (NDP forming)
LGNLTEAEAKGVLARYGIPVTHPNLVRSREAAERTAAEFATAVAMKISSPDIPHKSINGCVRLSVSPAQAGNAYDEIVAAAGAVDGARIDGVIVEAMAAPGVEIILGASRDPEFGPVVMFGTGGSSVEKRRDVEFRLAPLTPDQAGELVRSAGVSEALGRHARDALAEIVLSVAGADGILFREPVTELDINPLIVSTDGILAVDAHMTLAADGTAAVVGPPPNHGSTLNDLLKAVFEPSAIVVVGASTRPDKLGFAIIRNLVEFGFRGPLYAVHPTANNIYGCPTFARVEDVPDGVDRAIVAVAASEVPDTLRALADHGVRVAQVYSAGFAEWSEEGRSFEGRIREVTADTGLRVIGPNTIGTFSAAARMTLTAPRYSPKSPGTISFIGQSGTYVLDVISRSAVMGLPLDKALSCGNCVDLGPVDYLSFLASDTRTEVIGMYLETVREAGSFFRLAATVDKPIVLMKGGRSDAGLRAASSHTGALATNMALWTSSARQAGLILVDSIDEMLDVFLMLAAFGHRKVGRDVALFTSGGGISVGAADTAAAVGLRMVDLDQRSSQALARFGVPGTSVRNPIDIPVWGLKSGDRFIFGEMIDTLAADPGVQSVIACVEMGSVFSFSADEASGIEQMERIFESIVAAKTPVPVAVVFRSSGDRVQDDFLREVRPRMLVHGIAVFPSVDRAMRSLAAVAASSAAWDET